jgi:pimeloyl-ACP methyl ester carboxylesterase
VCRSTCLPPRYSEIIASRIPNARLEIIDGAGHAISPKHEVVSEKLPRFWVSVDGHRFRRE